MRNWIKNLKMKIREIIEAHYKDFLYVCKNKAINGEDEFDVLDNCCITAIRKFDEKDIDEQEGLDYLWRIFGAARFFRKKKVDKHLIFTELPPDIGVEDY